MTLRDERAACKKIQSYTHIRQGNKKKIFLRQYRGIMYDKIEKKINMHKYTCIR